MSIGGDYTPNAFAIALKSASLRLPRQCEIEAKRIIAGGASSRGSCFNSPSSDTSHHLTRRSLTKTSSDYTQIYHILGQLSTSWWVPSASKYNTVKQIAA
jgi:hypothetical protein